MSLLDVHDLAKHYGATRAVDGVSFAVARGEIVALVGESGSGKSTVARLIARLTPATGGEIRLDGRDVLAEEPRAASFGYRKRVQMIFQDPFASLNPAHTVAHHVERPLKNHHGLRGAALDARVSELLAAVGLTAEHAPRRPGELSGGQRQRVAIARALAVEPDLIIADEPTSMLDVSIRMGVLNLLARLKRERGVAILYITHDLASARYLADQILVMNGGQIVESGAAEAVLAHPSHPYTRLLIESVPRLEIRS